MVRTENKPRKKYAFKVYNHGIVLIVIQRAKREASVTSVTDLRD